MNVGELHPTKRVLVSNDELDWHMTRFRDAGLVKGSVSIWGFSHE
jgi:hypothetical protein